jgi:hypothetical protein
MRERFALDVAMVPQEEPAKSFPNLLNGRAGR